MKWIEYYISFTKVLYNDPDFLRNKERYQNNVIVSRNQF